MAYRLFSGFLIFPTKPSRKDIFSLTEFTEVHGVFRSFDFSTNPLSPL